MPTSLKTQRAVGYLRVSDPHQTGERHSSLETQESSYKDYCKQHNLLPLGVFTDVVSGRHDDRKEYRRMVEFVMTGGADVVVVKFLDRFGRNPKEILRRYWELQDHGVSVVATDEDIREELILLVKAGVAGAESKRNSERVRANMGKAISKGIHVGRPPYGLRTMREVIEGAVNVRWGIEPEEAPAVREMYRLAVEENLGYKAIADRLGDKKYRARGGRPFASYTIERILTNPAIMGTLIYGRKPRKGNPGMNIVEVSDFFPPILSQEEWQRLQKRIGIHKQSPRGKTHSSEYLLSGIARCGHCGGPITGKVGATYKGKRYRNYYCSRAMRSRELCPVYNGHSANRLESSILEYLGQFSDPARVRQYLEVAETKDTERYETELITVNKKIADLDVQFLTRLDDLLKRKLLTEQEFARANEAARSQKGALEARKEEITKLLKRAKATAELVEKVPKVVKTFAAAFKTMDIRQQKAQLQSILKAAHIYKDGRIELEFRGEEE